MSSARKGSKKSAKTATQPTAELAAPSSTQAQDRRSGGERREGGVDRRAFWRPTPDRRREERELGRRSDDQTSQS